MLLRHRGLPILVLIASALLPNLAVAESATAGPMRLDDAIELALTRNERARISDLQVTVAEAAVERARAGFLPIVTVTGNAQQNFETLSPAPQTTGNGAAVLNQPLVNASAWPLYAQARELADAQRAQNVDDRRQLGFAAAGAFFAVLNAEDVLRTAQRALDLAQANLADTKARAEAGLTSTNDVTRAQIDVAGSQRQVDSSRGNVDAAYIQLGFTVNAPVTRPLAAPEETLSAAQRPAANADALSRFAVSKRPDVLVSKHAAKAAHHSASEPMLRLLPTLNAQASFTGTSNVVPAGSNRWHDETVSANLTFTLYDAGSRYADKHSRDAQAEQADLTLQQLVRNVDAEVRTAVAQLASAQASFRSAEDQVQVAGQSATETAILYRQGLAKAIELVDANDTRFDAEISYAAAEYAMALAYLNLRQSVGLDPSGGALP